MESKCCNEFESCVSCCLQPQNDATTAMKHSPRGAGKPETGLFSNPFDYCCAKCRTNAKSTVHENAYKSPYHHCFGSRAYPEGADAAKKTPEFNLASVSIVEGEQGQSCATACAARKTARCVVEAIPSINNCETMKAHFQCEGGCENSFGEDQPAYVSPKALRIFRPGVCMINQRPDMMTCNGKHANTRRLCPCHNARDLNV